MLGNSYFIALVALLLLPPLIPALATPALDCQSAQTTAELEICRHSFLSALDQQMVDAYAITEGRLDAYGRRSLLVDQQQWERYRDGCGSQQGCLRALYARRIDELGKVN